MLGYALDSHYDYRSGAFRMTPTNHSPRTTYQGTNPHAAQRTSLVALGKSLWRNRRLIAQMVAVVLFVGMIDLCKTTPDYLEHENWIRWDNPKLNIQWPTEMFI